MNPFTLLFFPNMKKRKENFSLAKNWTEGSNFPMVTFHLAQSIDFKIPLAQFSVNVIPPANSERLFRSFAFNTPLPLEIPT